MQGGKQATGLRAQVSGNRVAFRRDGKKAVLLKDKTIVPYQKRAKRFAASPCADYKDLLIHIIIIIIIHHSAEKVVKRFCVLI